MHYFPDWSKKVSILLFWLLLWQALPALIGNPILLVGPVDTLKALSEQICSSSFWRAIWFSFYRIGLGFFLAFFTGLITGSMACALPWLRELLSPAIHSERSGSSMTFILSPS